jgi:signal transduction histidine kinase
LGRELEEAVVVPLRALAAEPDQTGGPALLRAQDALAAAMAGLRPPELVDGLAVALRTHPLVRSIDCELVLAEARCGDVVEDTLYSVAAEALANVAKHAGPCRATVRFEVIGLVATLSVTDDGSGGASPRAGSGLSELADRLEALEGSLTVLTVAGVGTTVTASVPRELTGAGPRRRSAADIPVET